MGMRIITQISCPSCKQDVPQESYFCTYCGTAMPYENP